MATERQFVPERGFAPPRPPSPFVGRENELEWLESRSNTRTRRFGIVLSVIGEAGIGKTALVAQYLEEHAEELTPIWFNCSEWVRRRIPSYDSLIRREDVGSRYRRRMTVVFDGADAISAGLLADMYNATVSWKAIERVIITSRNEVQLRAEQLVVPRMPEVDTERLFREKVALSNIDDNTALRVMGAANGHPDAMTIMAAMARSMSSEQLRRVLSGDLYDLNDADADKQRAVEREARPVIIDVSDDIIRRLKKAPGDVHGLTARQFEQLIADLLRDMGHDVTLTKATRDGGADILASMKTDIGEILCLVDAKKYRQDRKIGVGMVRTLYGTMADYQASSGMLVTTSSYSKDAQAWQQKHKYQLSLRDYMDVATWIQKYGNRH